MEVAENSAAGQGDYVDPSYDFYNAKNLTNTAENCSTDLIQEVRHNNTTNKTLFIAKSICR